MSGPAQWISLGGRASAYYVEQGEYHQWGCDLQAWAAGDEPAAARAAAALNSVVTSAGRFDSQWGGAQLDAAARQLNACGAADALVGMVAEAEPPAARQALRAMAAASAATDDGWWTVEGVQDALQRVLLDDGFGVEDARDALVFVMRLHTPAAADCSLWKGYDFVDVCRLFLHSTVCAFAVAICVYRSSACAARAASVASACYGVLWVAGILISEASAQADEDLDVWGVLGAAGMHELVAQLALEPPGTGGIVNKSCREIVRHVARWGARHGGDGDGRGRVAAEVASALAIGAAGAGPGYVRSDPAEAAQLLREEPFNMGEGAIAALLRAGRSYVAVRAKAGELRQLRTRKAIVRLAGAARSSGVAAAPAGAE